LAPRSAKCTGSEKKLVTPMKNTTFAAVASAKRRLKSGSIWPVSLNASISCRMRTLLSYFWRGCLVLAPVGITVYIAWTVVTTIDSWLPVGIPGLGFVLTIVIITVVGFLTSNVIGKAVVNELERMLARVPLIKLLYSSIRDLINAFVGEKKRFNRPVAVAVVPGSTAKALGFVTRESLTHLQEMKGLVAVYFPQSYNFAGNVLLVPREHVEEVEASSADVMTFIVSGGVSGLGIGEHGESIPPSRGPGAPPGPERTLILEQAPKK
jgi:uncharacterized membrane protein